MRHGITKRRTSGSYTSTKTKVKQSATLAIAISMRIEASMALEALAEQYVYVKHPDPDDLLTGPMSWRRLLEMGEWLLYMHVASSTSCDKKQRCKSQSDRAPLPKQKNMPQRLARMSIMSDGTELTFRSHSLRYTLQASVVPMTY